MAEATLKLLLLGEDRSAGKALKGVGGEAEKSRTKLQGVASVAGKALAGGLVAAGVAAVKLAKGAAEDSAAASRLAQTMQKTAGATKGQIAATEDWITAQGKAKGVADDELRPALSKLVTATHDVGKAQKLATLAMDISAGSGKSLEAVSAALARAQNGNVGALSRLGIKVKDSVKDNAALEAANIRLEKAQSDYNAALDQYGPHSKEAHLAASKLEYAQTKLGEAQGKTKTSTIDAGEAMKRLSDTYGGAAAKAADTVQGKQKRLTVELSEAGETIGYKLLPFMLKLTDAATAALGWMQEHPKLLKNGAIAAALLGGAILALNTGMRVSAVVSKAMAISQAAQAVAAGTATETQIALNAAMRANVIGIVITGLALLVGGLILAYKKSETFRSIVDGAFKGIAAAAKFMWDGVLKPVFKLWLNMWFTIVGALVNGAASAFGWVPGIGPKLKAAAAKFNEFRDDVNRALDGIHSQKEIHLKVTTQQIVANPSLGKPRVPHNAVGTRFFEGGMTMVGERGPELADLPRGTRIYTAGDSARMAGGGDDVSGTLVILVKSAETGETMDKKFVAYKRRTRKKKLDFELVNA